jgi:signal peptidase I
MARRSPIPQMLPAILGAVLGAKLRARIPAPWRKVLDWVITIVVAAGLVLIFEAEVAKPYRIPSESMEPTLHCARPAVGCEARFSDRVIACKLCYRFADPERGQIVVFNAPKAAALRCGEAGTYVKRLIGLPGNTVHEDSNGFIWINGKKLKEPYVTAAARAQDVSFRNHTWHVPQGSYFMLGDNRGNSCDSRQWGAVKRSSLIGPVVMDYWPPTRITFWSP